MDEKDNYQTIELFSGEVAKVDTEDYDKVNQYKWYADRRKHTIYAKANAGNKTKISMHRLILCANNGQEIDHKNHDGLDNRKSNLRSCTHKQNCMNSSKMNRMTSSKYKGVDKQGKKWRAQSRVSGRIRQIGYYDTEEEAANAYDNEVIKYGDENAFINFPERRKDVHR